MKFFLSLLFLYTINSAFSQTVVVTDSISNLPIPYAAIKLSDTTGFYTNEYGEFNFNLIPKTLKSIGVSCIGYIDKIYMTNKLIRSNYSIVLIPKLETLEEVYITPRRTTSKSFGYSKKSKNLTWHIGNKTELGIYIKPIKSIPKNYIKSVEIPINKGQIEHINGEYTMTRPNFKSVFRIHISEFNNGIPGSKLMDKPKIIKCNQNSKNILSIDVSDEKIELTDKGVFISIEMIGEIDENGNVINRKNSLPGFEFTYKSAKNFTSVQYCKSIFTNGWERYSWEKLGSKKDYNLAIGLTLNIYEK